MWRALRLIDGRILVAGADIARRLTIVPHGFVQRRLGIVPSLEPNPHEERQLISKAFEGVELPRADNGIMGVPSNVRGKFDFRGATLAKVIRFNYAVLQSKLRCT